MLPFETWITTFKIWSAGLIPLILHYSYASTIAALLLFLAFGLPVARLLPLVGPFLSPLASILKPLRGYFLIAAVAVIGSIWYGSVLVKDERARCIARTQVIEKEVDKIVRETTPDPSKPEHEIVDPWNNPDF